MPLVSFAFDQLLEKLAHFFLNRRQGAAAHRRGAVFLTQRAAVAFLRGSEIALALEAVQQGVEASRTYPVPVPGELFDHAKAEDRRLMHGMMQDVQRDQAGIEGVIDIEIRFRFPSANLRSLAWMRLYESLTGARPFSSVQWK
jgi:hypothetical protein